MITKFSDEKNFYKKIIFIIDDNEEYAKSLEAFIQNRFSDIKEIKRFRIGEMCLLELRHEPCIIIMNYFIKSEYNKMQNGFKIIKHIRMLKPHTKIIVLSGQEKFNTVVKAIKNDNCNYVQKDQKAFNKIEQLINNFFNHRKRYVFIWN